MDALVWAVSALFYAPEAEPELIEFEGVQTRRSRDLDRYLRGRAHHTRSRRPALPQTRIGEPFTDDGFPKVFQRLRRASGVFRRSLAHLMRHTCATNFMRCRSVERTRPQAR